MGTALENAREFCKETIKNYPALKKEVISFLQLAEDEIEAGASEVHECDLLMGEIEYLKGDHYEEPTT